MVTNYPHVTSHHVTAHLPAQSDVSVFARVMQWIRQMLCGLGGHDSVLCFEDNRVRLRCTSCHHDSPGWEVGAENRPRLRFPGDARRHILQRRPVLTMAKSA